MSSHQHKGVVTQIIGPVLDIRLQKENCPNCVMLSPFIMQERLLLLKSPSTSVIM